MYIIRGEESDDELRLDVHFVYFIIMYNTIIIIFWPAIYVCACLGGRV